MLEEGFMDIRVKKINILSKINVEFNLIEESVLQIKGVIDSKIKVEGNDVLIEYALDSWASDYDVMIKIMDVLEKEYSLDSEPYFEEDDAILYDDENVENNGEECETSNCSDEHCDHHDHDEHCDCHDHHHDHDDCHNGGCCCQDGENTGSIKSKIIELGVALGVFIIALILSNIAKTQKVAPYIFVIAYSIAGYEVLFNGISAIFKGKVFSENLLMTIASLCAIILGEVEEAVGIMFLFSVGSLFERYATDNSSKVINGLKELCPNTTTILIDGKEVVKKVDEVKVGDIILLKAGDRLALDGEIISGSASFDTMAITGESVYRDLKEGDGVFGGFINKNGVVQVKVLKDYKNSTLNKVVEIVKDSYKKKSKKESLIEKFAKWYTPTIVALAVILAFIPPIFYDAYGEGLRIWGVRAIMLLCISCPCALVLSVPLTYYLGVATCAKNGVLVKTTSTLEKLSTANLFVFDKTGTLTKGELKVVKVISTKEYQGKVLDIVASLEKNSNHPIAKAILNSANSLSDEVSNYQEIAGKGITATLNGKELICGNYKFLEENGVKFNKIEELATIVYLAVDKKFAGAVLLQDELRDEAYGAIHELYEYGVNKTVMLTGDNKEYAKAVRQELEMNVSVSELKPQEKVEELEKFIQNNKGKAVCFVGDGINDAPSITRADVGFAMGALGSDMSIDSADIVITDDDLSKVPYSYKIAKRTNQIAKQNLIASIAIKALVMILSITGLSSSLWLAIASDVGVLILAIFNSLRNAIK